MRFPDGLSYPHFAQIGPSIGPSGRAVGPVKGDVPRRWGPSVADRLVTQQPGLRNHEKKRSPQTELARQLERVRGGEVLDDPAVLDPADHDAGETHLSPPMSPVQRPARRN